MKKISWIGNLILALTVCVACSSKKSTSFVEMSPVTTSVSYSPLPTLVSTVALTPLLTPMPTPTVISTSLPTPTPIPQPPIATGWLTYTHPSGVSVAYPSDWAVTVSPYSVKFALPLEVEYHVSDAHNYVVIFNVYERPLEDQAIANPYTWSPNEGGYKIQWGKPIAVDGAEGLMFVWSQYFNDKWNTSPTLHAILYSKQYELDVRLETFFDSEGLDMAQTLGFTDTLSQRFQVFEHMIESVRFNQ